MPNVIDLRKHASVGEVVDGVTVSLPWLGAISVTAETVEEAFDLLGPALKEAFADPETMARWKAYVEENGQPVESLPKQEPDDTMRDAMKRIPALKAADVEEAIARGETVLVDLWAVCIPCIFQAPAVADAAERLAASGVRVAKIDVGAEPEFATKYGVSSIATLLLIRGEKVILRSGGALSGKTIFRQVADSLAESDAEGRFPADT